MGRLHAYRARHRTLPEEAPAMPGRRSHSRRDFLKAASAVAVGVGLPGFPAVIPSRVLGKDGEVAPSNRIVIGGIGTGGRGSYHLQQFGGMKDVQIAGCCDVDAGHLSASV